MNILITGATGSLGNSLVKESLKRNHTVIGCGHSERRIQKARQKYTDVPFYPIDMADKKLLANIVSKHAIEYIVHAAAMKHIGICENNPTKAINTNIIGSHNIIEVSKQFEVKNVIAVSTDKAINPSCVYGCTKLLMEKIMIEHGYSTLQGVNLFFSSGSVLEIWDCAVKQGDPIAINKNDTTRYFIESIEVAKKILDNLNSKGKYITLDECYRVSLHTLASAFCSYHNYENVTDYTSISAEKTEEEIPQGMKIIDTDQASLKRLLEEHYRGD
jgi:FlaA1/EpsC-like NDP-sugar epimerase